MHSVPTSRTMALWCSGPRPISSPAPGRRPRSIDHGGVNVEFPEGYADLFVDTSRAFLMLATLRPAGAPVIVPVWFVADADGLLFTTERDSLKARDMRARPEVGAVVMKEGEYARYVSVRGRVIEIDPAVA